MSRVNNAISTIVASIIIITILVLVLSSAWWLILYIWANLPSRY